MREDRPNVMDANREWECPSCTFVNNYRYSVYKKNCFMCGKEEDEDKEEDEEEEEEDSSEQRGLPATRKPLLRIRTSLWPAPTRRAWGTKC